MPAHQCHDRYLQFPSPALPAPRGCPVALQNSGSPAPPVHHARANRVTFLKVPVEHLRGRAWLVEAEAASATQLKLVVATTADTEIVDHLRRSAARTATLGEM